MAPGAQSVMTSGMLLRLVWSVDNWDIPTLVSLCSTVSVSIFILCITFCLFKM